MKLDASILTQKETAYFARMMSFNKKAFVGMGLWIGVAASIAIKMISDIGMMPLGVSQLVERNEGAATLGMYAIGMLVGFVIAFVMTKPASPALVEKELKRIHYQERLTERERLAAEESDPDALAWKERIAAWLGETYPQLQVERNDKTLVPSPYSNMAWPVDFVIPEITLAIQANAEAWRSRAEYEEDESFETEDSEAMYMVRCCARRGITLVHVWDSMTDEELQARISEEIDECLGQSG